MMTAGVRWQDLDVPDPAATQPPYALDPDLLTDDPGGVDLVPDVPGDHREPVTPVSADTEPRAVTSTRDTSVLPMLAGAGLLVVVAVLVVAIAVVLATLAFTLS